MASVLAGSSASSLVSALRRKRIDKATVVFTRVLIVTTLLCLVAWTFPSLGNNLSGSRLVKRESAVLLPVEALEEPTKSCFKCHFVYEAENQCAHVRAHCKDEQPSYIPYLQLYFCTLPHAKFVAFVWIILWLALLFSTIGLAASDFFCVNLESMAVMAGMGENLAGVTLLALGNGSSDIFSTFAAMYNNSGSLAIGELIGAAGFITTVVAGSMAFIRPFKVSKKSFTRDVLYFTLAVAFSLTFLADGKLHLWECIVMILMYVFYVCLVVFWHWYFKRNKRVRLLQEATRSHYSFADSGLTAWPGLYQDDEEYRESREHTSFCHSSRMISQSVASEAFPLDADATQLDANQLDQEDVEQLEERLHGEISSRMRLTRLGQAHPSTREIIRPSLIGALEFRTVLSGLHREGNLHFYALHSSRWPDDPTSGNTDASSIRSMPNHPHNYYDSPPAIHPTLSTRHSPGLHPVSNERRVRAKSAIEPRTVASKTSHPIPQINLLSPIVSNEEHPSRIDLLSSTSSETARPCIVSQPYSASDVPIVSGDSQNCQQAVKYDTFHQNISASDLLALPDPRTAISGFVSSRTSVSGQSPHGILPSSYHSPLSFSPRRLSRQNSMLDSLSAAAITYDAIIANNQLIEPIRFWPYWLLPRPEAVLSSLFPTLYLWREKSFWGRVFGIISAASVFLLTITLPVVEISKNQDNDDGSIPDLTLPSGISPLPHALLSGGSLDMATHANNTVHMPNHDGSTWRASYVLEENCPLVKTPEQLPCESPDAGQGSWNRWLVMIQMFTAPLFCILVVWANVDFGNTPLLIRMSLIGLVFSIVAATFIAVSTTGDRAPTWQGLLCILGFCVSIGWISTIAGEVVGVLKALGVILNISDAILGLTVFAVGNSLGDLVADATMAKLGYPVMALSACFGGPMLNILLGVGVSGAYMTFQGARKRKQHNPDGKWHFKPYYLEIDRTLMISGVVLLATLLGLLIVVPLRKWKMDRLIGWSLIGLWSFATIGNLTAELVLGNGKLH